MIQTAAGVLFLVLALLGTGTGETGASEQRAALALFGPKTYACDRECPVHASDEFSVANPGTDFTLRVDNDGVSSAKVILNGEQILGRGDFGPQVSIIIKRVVLAAKNTLEVEISGKPAESMAVRILGEEPTSMLTVHAVRWDPQAPDHKGPSLGAGVRISVNGREVGTTDDGGLLRTEVMPGSLHVTGTSPSEATGEANVSVLPLQAASVDLLLKAPREEPEAKATLTSDEVSGHLLDPAFTALTLRFVRNGLPIPISKLVSIELVQSDGRRVAVVDGDFTLDPGGLIRASQLGTLQRLFRSQTGAVTIRVTASDVNGLVYEGTLSFFVARARITGTLAAPPSFPRLQVEGIAVRVEVLGTPIVFTSTAGAGGKFDFPRVPFGMVEFDSSTVQEGKYYYGQALVSLSGDVSISLPMRNVVDIEAGVPPVALLPLQTREVQSAGGRGESPDGAAP